MAKTTRGPALHGQLEITLGNVGDGCDYMTVVVEHVARGQRLFDRAGIEFAKAHAMLDRAYRSSALGYRGILTAIEGKDPGDERGIPPREREARQRAMAGVA